MAHAGSPEQISHQPVLEGALAHFNELFSSNAESEASERRNYQHLAPTWSTPLMALYRKILMGQWT